MSASIQHTEAHQKARLDKFFNNVLSGQQTLKSLRDGDLFIEAVCAQPDLPTCVNKLTSSPKGLQSVQACMRFNISPTYLNGPATRLLTYIQDPALKVICEGDFLRQIIIHIVEPPIFWNAFVQAFRDGTLELLAQQAFGWLLLELVSLLDKESTEHYSIAQDPAIQSQLLNSTNFEIRTLGHKVKHILSSLSSPATSNDDCSPGGRHDNDFPDFREISILPTADELTSEEPPFLRIAQAIEDPDTEATRLAIHLDNQFR